MKIVTDPCASSDPRRAHIKATIELPDHDVDLEIIMPNGVHAELQWRIETPTLDLCFDRGMVVYNEDGNMGEAPADENQRHRHRNVRQLVILE